MKKIILFLLLALCFCKCGEKKELITFVALDKNEFTSFKLHENEMPDSLKRSHDSCMGISFDANAIFSQVRNALFIGSIVNKRSLNVVNTINALGLNHAQLISQFNIISHPCYEKRSLHLPLKSLLGRDFTLQLPGADEKENKEINDAVSASTDAEMETGSWLYLDMTSALKNILDTARSVASLNYKRNMLDTANMVLIAVESIMDVSFIINTENGISAPLQALLKEKPSQTSPNKQFSIKYIFLTDKKFEITLNGFFPIIGQFVKAKAL